MSDDPETVSLQLTLEASTDSVRYARLVASAVADDAGFDVDEIDDLKIAIDEACVAVIEGSTPTGSLMLSFVAGGEIVDVSGSCEIEGEFDEPDLTDSSLQSQILRAVVDEVTFSSSGGSASFRMRKRR